MNSDSIISADSSILITGSNGFIGAKVVETLLEKGFRDLRCLVRSSSRLGRLNTIINRPEAIGKVKLITGDLLSRDDCKKSTAGTEIVYHLAAGMDKSFAGAFMNSAVATRNLIEAFLEFGQPKRFVCVSSFAVYSNLKMKRGSLLDENGPLEDEPQERYDAYGYGKLKQEEIVRDYAVRRNLPFVILRPGAVFGPGNPSLTGRVGIDTFGFLLHMGGSNQIPLTFVDNCAEAIVLGGLKPGVEGETFNIVDNDLPSSADFFRSYRRRLGKSFSLSLPYPVAERLCAWWEKYSTWSGGQLPPVFNRRRCAAEWKGNSFSNQKLREKLGWNPRIKMPDAIERFLGQFGPGQA